MLLREFYKFENGSFDLKDRSTIYRHMVKYVIIIYLGKLIQEKNFVEGFLCGNRFLKSEKNFEENKIRDIFKNKNLFFGYKELTEIYNCEIDAIPISAELKEILEMPCPFTKGKKIYETHYLMLYPTMLGY